MNRAPERGHGALRRKTGRVEVERASVVLFGAAAIPRGEERLAISRIELQHSLETGARLGETSQAHS